MENMKRPSPMSFGKNTPKPAPEQERGEVGIEQEEEVAGGLIEIPIEEALKQSRAMSEEETVEIVEGTRIPLREYEARRNAIPLYKDKIFYLVMQSEHITTPIVRELLDDPGATIKEIIPQYDVTVMSHKEGDTISMALDIVVFMSNGEVVNLEMQTSNETRGPLVDRALMHGAALLMNTQQGVGAAKYTYNRVVVCFFCKKAWDPGAGGLEYVSMYNTTRGKQATDKLTLVFARSDLFEQIPPGYMQELCSVLSERPRRTAYTQAVQDTLHKVCNDGVNRKVVNEVMAEDIRVVAKREGVAEGRVEIITSMLVTVMEDVKRGVLSSTAALSQVARFCGISEGDVQEVASRIGIQF